MSIQTDAMLELAGDDAFITAGQHPDTNKWYGMLFANHPTPSGSPRWSPIYSDKRGWNNPKQAAKEFVSLNPEKFGKIKNMYEEPNKK